MIVRNFEKQDLKKCISLYIEVFNQPPWNNNWTYELAEGLFMDFCNTPGFLGYVAVDETEEIIAVLIGKEKKWWRGKEYVTEEFFVRPELQGQGVGSHILDFIYKDIKAKGIEKVTLLTSTFTPAYKFYLNKGYKENQSLRLLYKNI
ncbi:GNAT family N-acetyltransferase [Paenibacillus beijingensis]|uniref:N-acetyltransferase domain-containing protein n=1 Tax=Paenibacillus beijingensis TaxID=1126833 RepID=A0A0D5NMJ1_9BACL|nr:GNAT family N-acetyltransferase [Paenibacillus beijingensis]AJY76197.1 hypothetical protein VN24_18545 [Paenibacillus beijingensis]